MNSRNNENCNQNSTGCAQPGAGHNGGPPIRKLTSKHKVERIKEVLDMDISAAQKCIGIRIIADADTDGITPELSTEDLKRSASVKDRVTVYRATQKLDEKKVAKAVKEDGRPNRYLVLPSEAIDAVLDEIDTTGRAEPHPPTAMKQQCDEPAPVGSDHTPPVGLDPTTGVRPSPTSAAGPDGLDHTGGVEPHTPSRTPPPARDITTHATKESPSEIVTYEEMASKLAIYEREHKNQSAAEEPDSLLAGSNDLIDQMVADAHRWLGQPTTIADARRWLANTLSAYGDDVAIESYHKLKTDILTGKRIANPIPTWSRIAQRMKAERSAQAPASDSCWVDENGLHLVNGYRSEWLSKFDNSEERLDLAIKTVAADVKLRSQTPIKMQVDGMLAKLAGEKIDKDERYARAAASAKPEKGISRLKEKFLRAGE